MVTMMRKVQMRLLAMSQKWRMLARKLFKSSTYLVDVIILQMLMLV